MMFADSSFDFRIRSFQSAHIAGEFAPCGERRAMKSLIVKRSIVIDGHKTSVSLEDVFWNALRDIAHARGESLS